MTQIDLLIQRYPQLECCKNDILLAFELLKECYSNDGKLLACVFITIEQPKLIRNIRV